MDDPDVVESIVREMLPRVTTLSSKMELIGIIGHRESRGHKLVSQSAAAGLERYWRSEVRQAVDEALAEEPQLLRVLLLTRREAEGDEAPVEVPETPGVTLALLRSGRTDVVKQAMGSRAVERLPRLAWKALVELYGEESVLRERIEALGSVASGEDSQDLLRLAGKYLAGWSPGDMDEE